MEPVFLAIVSYFLIIPSTQGASKELAKAISTGI